jgi:hypothetical protein
MRVERYSTDTTAPQLALRKSRGSLSAATAVATSDALGNILFQGYGGSTTRNLASVAATVSAYVSDTDIATYLTINTSAAGGITATEGFRIASDKTTTLGGTSTAPAFKIFPVASQVNYLAASASATGNSVAFSALGTDTNINVSHQSKGTGGFFFGTNAGATTQVVITDTASANRYITLTGSNGGNPTIGTSGGSLAVSTGLAVPSDSACGGIWYMKSGTAIPAGGVQAIGVSSTATMGVYFGSGAPTVSAAKGSLYLRSDGSTTNDRMYVNTNGTTTWTAVTTAA